MWYNRGTQWLYKPERRGGNIGRSDSALWLVAYHKIVTSKLQFAHFRKIGYNALPESPIITAGDFPSTILQKGNLDLALFMLGFFIIHQYHLEEVVCVGFI